MALNTTSLSPSTHVTSSRSSVKQWTRDVIALTKPGIVFSSVLTAGGGLWLATTPISMWLTLATLIGTGLSVGGACALNMFLERNTDAMMPRTQNRPLPAHRLPPRTALLTGLGLGLSGFLILWFAVNPLTGLLCALAYVSYTLIYTPLKKRTSLAFVIGTLPGAIPALMGWTAAANSISLEGSSLFIIMIFWQLVHSLALAMGLRSQYAKANIPTFTGVYGMKATRYVVFLFTLGLILASLLPIAWQQASWWYGAPALMLGGWIFGSCLSWLQSTQPVKQAKRFFLHTLLYLVLLFGALIMGTIF